MVEMNGALGLVSTIVFYQIQDAMDFETSLFHGLGKKNRSNEIMACL